MSCRYEVHGHTFISRFNQLGSRMAYTMFENSTKLGIQKEDYNLVKLGLCEILRYREHLGEK